MMAGAGDEPFFEGTEKLLEVWFSSTIGDDSLDLRDIDRGHWETLLRLVKCTIISMSRNESMDAYVLSESSMFVTKDRFILKTCGKTTLLLAIKPLLEIVQKYCGFDDVKDVFYSRKKFMKPDQQDRIHRNFEDEVLHLEEMFETGSAYSLGRINRDCWYLYTLDGEGVTKPDQTIELLMWDLCRKKMEIFTTDVSKDGRDATKKSGICNIIPGVQIDDYLFEPCGYSMNGLLPEGKYITIHITPEPGYSYVSFESNVPQESYNELINRVLDTFRPGKFLLTIFANKASIARESHKGIEDKRTINNYNRQDHQTCVFKEYHLTYSYFTRPVI
ncbi:hypothetical protein ACJMK2_029563 [Sinanodonta woodiana]|uniref:adenosylmethionine decarboxylase n=1 Tax=Sinanodonta woodiana TaxID=1069815 RepID=A0ABD3XB09_SINWO